VHNDVQEKVVDEITIMTSNASKVDNETLQELSYLQCVIDESLRLYSPTLRVERVCSKEAVINGLHIPVKTTIVIPIQAIHLDPDLWPDPLTFNPKRFTTEERAKRDPYSWQPFGMGPRSCVGVRLALMQMKMALVHILRAFKVSTSPATVQPIQRHKVTGAPQDVFLKFEPRD
jgi:cytochrome P450 family 3 subfamily A